MIDCKPVDTPMMVNQKLYMGEKAKLADKGRYQRIVGKLIYLSHTRPDIAYAVGVVSQFMHQPQISHMKAVLRIIRCLKGTPGHGVLFKANGHLETQVYTDADWAGDKGNRRSTSGYFTLVGGNLVTWRSKKQKVLLSEIGYHSTQTSKIMCDNKAAIQNFENPFQHDRTKHIEVDRHFIKEKIENGIIELPFVRSKDQLADILTKASSESLDFEVLIVGYEHVVMNCGSAGNRKDQVSRKDKGSLVKGLEELKWEKDDVHDYVDEEYISWNGSLYAIKVNSLSRFLSFINLIKRDSIVYKHWDIFSKKYVEMLKWFYLVHLNYDMLEGIPPVIGVMEINLLGLHKTVDGFGGYLCVTLVDKWKTIANLQGLTDDNGEIVKGCYKKFIDMVQVYYETTKMPCGDSDNKGAYKAAVVGDGCCVVPLESKEMLVKRMKEVEAFNASKKSAKTKDHAKKIASTRKEKRARAQMMQIGKKFGM
nr:putative ribonuclease H-like domain-containing protein [Tanacetum cinerariifolium]